MGGRFLALALILLFSCCLSGEPETIIQEKYLYVCSQGDIVSEAGLCEKLKPEKIEVYRFVCFDGEIVDDSRECQSPEDLETTTSFFPEETSTRAATTSTSFRQQKKKATTTSQEEETTTTEASTSSTVTSFTLPEATTSTLEETSTTAVSQSTTSTTLYLGDGCVLLGCLEDTSFVGSESSDKYHLCSCRYAKKIKPENIICFKDKKEAEDAGYVPCGVCKPSGA